MRFIIELLLTVLFFGGTARSQDPVRPLPDLDSFLKEVRRHLRSDRQLLSQYTYLEKSTQRDLDKNGKAIKTHVVVSEIYPAREGGITFHKVISRDGRPLSAEELQKQDREHTRRLEDRQRKLDRESPAERQKRLAKASENRKREEEEIDEIFKIYDVRMIGRDKIERYPAVLLAFKCRPGYQPKTLGGKAFTKIEGRAWVGEEDHELVRVEAELIDNFTIGMGILARLNKGAKMAFERKRVNDEIWLPSTARFSGTGRLMLFKGLRLEVESEYWDYKKFTVQTSVSY